MKFVFLLMAILTLTLAHYFKILRMKKFIEIYEKPNQSNLLQALSLGYCINFIFPFKLIGEMFRVWYQGRKMKNGFSFGLSTVIIDRLLDIIMVVVIFIIFYLLGFKTPIITNSITFYLFLFIFIVMFFILIIETNLKKYIKIIIMKIAHIFNEDIELKILKISWFVISSFKDLVEKISKKTIVLYTCAMWILYLTSYIIFAFTMRLFGENINVVDIFTSLFSSNSLLFAGKAISINNVLMFAYLLCSALILLLISFFHKQSKEEKRDYLELLPQVNCTDRLAFLEGYFSAQSREYFENYIKINRDISIMKDYSSGSNATTMLCVKENQTFFRKYAFLEDSEKLYDQIQWIENHSDNISVTSIINKKKAKGYCLYDMPYNQGAIGCFNYIHTVPTLKSWNIIEKALDELNRNLYCMNVRKANDETVEKYINSKVLKNLEKIKSSKYIKPLLKYEVLIINGKKYNNLPYFEKYLSKSYLEKIFINDCYSDIHGDLTIENIIVIPEKDSFYLIDPNTGNLHDSPNLDYAKLLQSLHGGYEFLMNTKDLTVTENTISYLSSKSDIYEKIYKLYDEYLSQTFNYEKIKSIYFHEIVHWLRLLPYKIEKTESNSVLFYCGLIMILNDIIERFGE